MRAFIGIDVSSNHGCAIAAIDDSGRSIGTRWTNSESVAVVQAVLELGQDDSVCIGIDSPRTPVDVPRESFWDGKAGGWRKRRKSERGHGRHCEVIISSLKLATPQWTPPASQAPKWMQLGFELFEALKKKGEVLEVFPSASYNQLADEEALAFSMSLSGFAKSPKDMLDAYVSALTVREFKNGNGAAVGGGDGLGEIILPRGLDQSSPLFRWPT